LVATIGSYYVQVEEISSEVILASISMGIFACVILAINNIRDRALDAPAGKRTLAVRLVDRRSRQFFTLLILLGYLSSALIGTPWIALTLLSLPVAIKLSRGVMGGAQGRELIPYLTETGKLQLQYALLLSIALLLSHG
jgi:1,4-dihydroxy-2-naphthoate octaprenyltransferase